MLISAFFCRIYIPFNMDRLLLNPLFVHIKEFHGILLHADDLFIFDKIHVSGVLQYCRHVRSDNAPIRRMSHDQRAVLAHCIKFVRKVFEDDTKRIRPFHAVHDLCDRTEGITVIVVIKQMGDDLGICI